MEVKLFEVRDRATFIACFAILMKPSEVRVGKLEVKSTPLEINVHDAEAFLLRRSGYGFDFPSVIFGRLDTGEAVSDIYDWARRSPRTLFHAHHFVIQNWESLRSGDVIDVEFILGEKTTKKTSEREGSAIVLPRCGESYPGEDGITQCTEDLGHSGDHQTVLGGEVLARWERA